MDLIIVVGALALLMIAAYRGYSVILFAPNRPPWPAPSSPRPGLV